MDTKPTLRFTVLFFAVAVLMFATALVSQQTDVDAPQRKGKQPEKKPPVTKPQPPVTERQAAVTAANAPPMEEVQTQGFFYKPGGRRDPFWDLLRGKSVKVKREAKEGIAGLLIDELELEGILLKEDEYIALFKGPDGKPYDVRIGNSVYDGEVIKIDMNSVVFKRLLTIALGGTKEKLITKRLTPEEEASKK